MIPSHAGVLAAGGHVCGVESVRVGSLDWKSTILTNISIALRPRPGQALRRRGKCLSLYSLDLPFMKLREDGLIPSSVFVAFKPHRTFPYKLTIIKFLASNMGLNGEFLNTSKDNFKSAPN